MTKCVTRLLRIHAHSGRAVNLIGWSFGGLHARELARRQPQRVRLVITLGTPFRGEPNPVDLWKQYRRLSGQPF